MENREFQHIVLKSLLTVTKQLNHMTRILGGLEMTSEELQAALVADLAEENTLAGLITTLLTAIQNADNVPQSVVDAHTQVKTALDALVTQASGH